MFPLKDNVPHLRPPYVTYGLIALNCLFFFWELSLGHRFFKALEVLGFIPARFLGQLLYTDTPFSQVTLPLFTSIFLHGSWLHLFGNMWFLFVFGDNVEDVLGHWRYLFFYLVCGLGSNLIYLFFAPTSTSTLVGASGAIAGVMGAYFTLYPGARVLTLFLIVIFPIFVELRAYYFLGLWFLLQFLYGTFGTVQPAAAQTGVAWWAHVGGFLWGLMLIRLLTPGRDWLLLRRSRGSWRED